MVDHGASELIESKTIQSADQILATTDYIAANNKRMQQILDNLAK